MDARLGAVQVGAVSRAGPVVLLFVGIGISTAGVLMLVYRDHVLRVLSRSPGSPEGSSGFRLLSTLNALIVPLVMVPLGLVIASVGLARLV
jgi:hypothetical protein